MGEDIYAIYPTKDSRKITLENSKSTKKGNQMKRCTKGLNTFEKVYMQLFKHTKSWVLLQLSEK